MWAANALFALIAAVMITPSVSFAGNPGYTAPWTPQPTWASGPCAEVCTAPCDESCPSDEFCNFDECGANCNTLNCGTSCVGDGCAYGCSANTCGAVCSGRSCAQNCQGIFCGGFCLGHDCANGCQGENCAHRCRGDRCANGCTEIQCGGMCVGDSCAKECGGNGCGQACIGDNCASECSGENCGENCLGYNCASEGTAGMNEPGKMCGDYTLEIHCISKSNKAKKSNSEPTACLWQNNACIEDTTERTCQAFTNNDACVWDFNGAMGGTTDFPTHVQCIFDNNGCSEAPGADKIACETDCGCTGNGCGKDCTKNSCAGDCKGNLCASTCKGTYCGSLCEGKSCASGCIGDRCGNQCFGDSCAKRCIGTDCGVSCYGDNCAQDCVGINCGAYCLGYNCGNEYSIGRMDPGKTCDKYTNPHHCVSHDVLRPVDGDGKATGCQWTEDNLCIEDTRPRKCSIFGTKDECTWSLNGAIDDFGNPTTCRWSEASGCSSPPVFHDSSGGSSTAAWVVGSISIGAVVVGVGIIASKAKSPQTVYFSENGERYTQM